MSYTVEKLRILVASPGDVAHERQALKRVCDDLNITASGSGIAFEVVRWETHVRPGIGQDAQDVINRQLPDYDVFIGIMWRRFGTPSSRASSGTEEEFNRALDNWRETRRPEIMIYFKEAPYFLRTQEEVDQASRVLAFRNHLEASGILVWTYKSESEFADIARRHLELLLKERGRRPAAAPVSPQRPQELPNLSEWLNPSLVSFDHLERLGKAVAPEKKRKLDRLILQLELLGTTPELEVADLEDVRYAERVSEQIRSVRTDVEDFGAIEHFLSLFAGGAAVQEESFFDVIEKWRFSTRRSRQKVVRELKELGNDIGALLCQRFLWLDEVEKVDGYYIPVNIQGALCEVLGEVGGQLPAVALFLFIKKLPHFDSSAMQLGLRALGTILGTRARLGEAYTLATGRSLDSDEDLARQESDRFMRERRRD